MHKDIFIVREAKEIQKHRKKIRKERQKEKRKERKKGEKKKRKDIKSSLTKIKKKNNTPEPLRRRARLLA